MSSAFTGLSAFPLTPLKDGVINDAEYIALIQGLACSGVDSIGALGSTGSYAYLTRAERGHAARLAVQAADGVPVIVGVGALRTRDVFEHVDDAHAAGAAGILLAPLTYQPLSDEEVFGLYADVAAHTSLPVVVYDNPATTGVTFSDELHSRIAHLDGITSIKIPAVPDDPSAARARIDRLRAVIPETVTIGVSGDGAAAAGLNAGCDSWYSVLAGILPATCLPILRAAHCGSDTLAKRLSAELSSIWDLFTRYGSYRVAAAIAQELGLISSDPLPCPVQGLEQVGRTAVRSALIAAGIRS